MNRKVKWMIFGGAVLLLGVALFFLTQEPPLPYKFLAKYPVVDRRTTKDGAKRFLIVKGKLSDIAADAESEIKPTMVGSSTSMVNGVTSESRTYGTQEGQIELTTDLSGDSFESGMSFGPGSVGQSKDGYTAIAYTRPKSLMDRAFDWVRNLFGRPEPRPSDRPQAVAVEVL